MGSKEVAETCFAFLHMELVRMALGGDTASISTPELQQAGRKVEAVGFQVGQRLIERYTKDRPRFSDTLEKIKFICKDFWFEIYRKQIDKLKTNNRGVYMLQDDRHRLLSRCAPANATATNAKQMCAIYAKFPSGLIRGALHGLGVVASVGVEFSEPASCQFTIKITQSADA